jgi:uncharacterized protein YuzE
LVTEEHRSLGVELRVGELAVRITYDPEADAAFVYLVDEIQPGEGSRSLMCDLEIREGAVILVLDGEDRLVGVEILGASRLLPNALLRS